MFMTVLTAMTQVKHPAIGVSFLGLISLLENGHGISSVTMKNQCLEFNRIQLLRFGTGSVSSADVHTELMEVMEQHWSFLMTRSGRNFLHLMMS